WIKRIDRGGVVCRLPLGDRWIDHVTSGGVTRPSSLRRWIKRIDRGGVACWLLGDRWIDRVTSNNVMRPSSRRRRIERIDRGDVAQLSSGDLWIDRWCVTRFHALGRWIERIDCAMDLLSSSDPRND